LEGSEQSKAATRDWRKIIKSKNFAWITIMGERIEGVARGGARSRGKNINLQEIEDGRTVYGNRKKQRKTLRGQEKKGSGNLRKRFQ